MMKQRRFISMAFVMVVISITNLSAQNWQLVWADEFTNGISPDWVFETGAGGWGNNEYQYYRRENAAVENGQLVITAKRESFGGANYTSARMKTQGKKSWQYGKIEARIAMPAFAGIWPAFWMLGDNISSVGWPSCGEIDVMEHINAENKTYGTIHWTGPSGTRAEYSGNTAVGVTGYHTYTVEWNASMIRWFVDGVKYHEASIAGSVNSTEEFHKKFFILLNMAVGGNWPGFNIDNNGFPAKMYVDYVRVYQDNGTPPSGVATMYKDCDFGGYAVGLPSGSYTLSQLQSRGIINDDISSLKINSGYEVQLFEHDNFTGANLVLSSSSNCLVGQGWNDRASSLIVRTASPSFSRTIEAENYSAMLGVQTEACVEGGSNVGWIDAGDWMAYNSINFPSSGSYRVEYRVASMTGGRLSLDLNAGAIQLGALNVPATNGWQNWTTVSHIVNVSAGTYNLGIYAPTGGWNLNWIRITKVNNARTASSNGSSGADDNAVVVSAQSIDLYPNPAESTINIVSTDGVTGLSYSIVDAYGTSVLNGELAGESIAVDALNAGIYTLVIYQDGNKLTRRFVKR